MIDSFQDIVIFLVLVPIHEMLHVILLPDKISSADIFVGTYRGAIYATYLRDIKKERFLLGGDNADHCINGYSHFNYIVNKCKLYSLVQNCPDEYGSIEYGCHIVLWDIPANAKIRNKESRTYWKF